MSGLALQWRFLSFGELSVPELYEVLQLRSEVFVVEQACAFQDMDGADQHSMHLLGKSVAGQLQAYARCLPPGLKFKEASIGRVLTCELLREQGAGLALMKQAIAQLHQHWGPQAIRIGAQSRLQAFYQKLGFVPVGQTYIEDGISHIEMLRP